MLATLVLIGCAMVPGQTTRADWVVRPQLSAGQEFVYTGTFKTDTFGSVQYGHAYRLETRVLVLEASRANVPVALYTVLRSQDTQPAPGESAVPASVRLQRGSVDQHGLLTLEKNAGAAVPLEGPPTLEIGAFLELPSEQLNRNQSWAAAEAGRPPRNWQIAGTELAAGASCIKILGEQKTSDWDRPQLDRIAWRRLDTVWLSPRTGIACKVERVIEKREPGHIQPTQRNVLRYDLESSVVYSGQMLDDRRREVLQTLSFAAVAEPLLAMPAQSVPQLRGLASKIAYHIEQQPPTPYREVVLQLRRLVEAGLRGEVTVMYPPDTPPADTGCVALNELAPDFVAPEFGARSSTTLHRWLGKPVLLVFFNPTSPSADQVLTFAQKMADTQRVTVLGLAMHDDFETVRKTTEPLSIRFPLLNGTGLRRSYNIEATPKIVVLDGTGVVRASYLGWGNEIPRDVIEDVKRWLKK